MKNDDIKKQYLNYIRKIKAITNQIEITYKSMEGLIGVLLNRPALVKYTYDYMTSERLKEMCKEIDIDYSEKLKEPYLYAMGYTHTVFIISGFEAFMQNIYHNSFAIYCLVSGSNDFKKDISSLPKLKEKFDTNNKAIKKKMKAQFQSENIEVKVKVIKKFLLSIGISDLDKIIPLFDDIYGENCLDQALTTHERKKFSKIIQELVEERNGILHRGGEYSVPKGSDKDYQIKFDINKFRRRHDELNEVGENLYKILKWTKSWWFKKLGVIPVYSNDLNMLSSSNVTPEK